MTALKVATALPLMTWILWGCTPNASGPSPVRPPQPASSPHSAGTPSEAKSWPAPTYAASYEVSIASAQADRVRARDHCDSQPPAERKTCREVADQVFDRTKGAADSADSQHP